MDKPTKNCLKAKYIKFVKKKFRSYLPESLTQDFIRLTSNLG